MAEIKKAITKYSIIVALIAEIISLFVFGPGILFPYGLVLGVCAALVNMGILSFSIDRAIALGKKGPVNVGLIVRIIIYAAAFFISARTGHISGIGTAIGFILPKLAMQIEFNFLPWFRRKTGREPEPVFVTDKQSKIFDKEPRFVLYNKGRMYVTHRKYRKVRQK